MSSLYCTNAKSMGDWRGNEFLAMKKYNEFIDIMIDRYSDIIELIQFDFYYEIKRKFFDFFCNNVVDLDRFTDIEMMDWLEDNCDFYVDKFLENGTVNYYNCYCGFFYRTNLQ